MSKHTPEPWHHERVEAEGGDISYDLWGGPLLSSGYTLVGNVSGVREHDERPSRIDADRIVACVNALAGIQDPAEFLRLACTAIVEAENGNRSDEPICPYCMAELMDEAHKANCIVHPCRAYLEHLKMTGPQPKASSNEDSYRKAEATYAFHAHYDHLQAGAAALTAGEAAIVLARDRTEGQRFRWLGLAELWLGKATFEVQELEKGGDEILARGLRERALKVSDDVEAFDA